MIHPRHPLLAFALVGAALGPARVLAQTNGIPATAPTGNAPQASPAAANAPASTATQKPSSLIAPAVDHLSQVVSQVQLERWKREARDETDSNLRSVERNVSTTLPQLVTNADAQPSSVAASLPLLRNLDALCAVIIRVSVTARASAPTPQAEALAGALTALQSARNTLADQVQSLATAQEKQIAALNSTVATLTTRASTPPPPPPLAPATKPRVKKKKAAAKPAVKPAQAANPSAPPSKPTQ